jgi:hypothetical protein
MWLSVLQSLIYLIFWTGMVRFQGDDITNVQIWRLHKGNRPIERL